MKRKKMVKKTNNLIAVSFKGNKRPFLHASKSFAGIKHVVSIVLDVVRFHKMFVKCTNKKGMIVYSICYSEMCWWSIIKYSDHYTFLGNCPPNQIFFADSLLTTYLALHHT